MKWESLSSRWCNNNRFFRFVVSKKRETSSLWFLHNRLSFTKRLLPRSFVERYQFIAGSREQTISVDVTLSILYIWLERVQSQFWSLFWGPTISKKFTQRSWEYYPFQSGVTYCLFSRKCEVREYPFRLIILLLSFNFESIHWTDIVRDMRRGQIRFHGSEWWEVMVVLGYEVCYKIAMLPY